MEKWQRVFQRQEGESSSGAAGAENQDGEESREKPGSSSGSTPTDTDESQSPFKDPALAGKSAAEIEQLFTVQRAALREQSQRLTSLEGEIRERPARTIDTGVQTPVPDEKVDPADYWKDPIGYQAKERQKIVEAIEQRLEATIAPFKQDMLKNREDSAWAEVRAKYSDFGDFEPLTRELLRKSGVQATPDTIELFYYTAVGVAQKQRGQASPEKANGEPAFRPPPPQHMPSNQPIKQERTQKRYRELTENERTLARLNGLTPEEYLDEMEKLEEDVIKPSARS